MTINKQLNGEVLTISLEGRLDTLTSTELDAELPKIDDKVKEVILDLEKLDYVSSSGLRVILALHKKMEARGKLIIKNLTPQVEEIFSICGFIRVLNFQK